MIPESDAPIADAGEIDVSYFDDDLAHTISQNDVTTTFALDALGRRKTSTITGQPTQTRHYGDDSDNPAWLTNSDGMLTRMTTSLDGLGAMVLGDGTAALVLGNPHGDNVTTVVLPPAQPETQDAVPITGWIDYDEYGRSKTGAETGIGYGWLGKHERSTSIESAGLTLMGVRLYNPARGAFTSTDPVRGGNTTAYTYPQDPINWDDLDGELPFPKPWLKKLLKKLGLNGRAVPKGLSDVRGVLKNTKWSKTRKGLRNGSVTIRGISAETYFFRLVKGGRRISKHHFQMKDGAHVVLSASKNSGVTIYITPKGGVMHKLRIQIMVMN